MRIDDEMNLVIPVRDGEMFVYHAPISKEAFEANYKPLAAAKAELSSKGVAYQMLSGPSIAALVLKDEFRRVYGDQLDTAEKLIGAFFAELKRLSTALVATADGYEMKPVDAAIKAGALDQEEWEETASSLVFFTCHYWLTKRAQRRLVADATASLLQGFVTSSQPSAWSDFLPSSTSAESSAQPGKAASSVPV